MGPLSKPKILLFAGIAWFVVLLTAYMNGQLARLQARSDPRFPAGVVTLSNGRTYTQDFAYQVLFFRGIRDGVMARPYTMADQEAFIRRVLPISASGMTHAYSPVAFVLALPLVALPGQGPYLAYTVLCALGFILLLRFWLLPRTHAGPQLAAIAVCTFSLCFMFGLEVGQSAILTTTLLGTLWALLQHRAARDWKIDVLLALLFWALCLKPSVTIVPVMLLLGARAWRPLLLGAALLLVTWTLVCGHYGGWRTGLQDYAQFLNHYNNAGMSPFLRRGEQSAAGFHRTELLFSLNRILLPGLSAGLLWLRWAGRITAPEHFLGTAWVFLLFSPYLLPSELWLLVLLVVEGRFFRAQHWPSAVGKLLLLAAVLDLRDGMALPIDVNYPLKCLLAAWVLIDAVRTRSSVPIPASSS